MTLYCCLDYIIPYVCFIAYFIYFLHNKTTGKKSTEQQKLGEKRKICTHKTRLEKR